MHLIIQTFGHALMITGFVAVMMLVIEYLNVATRGRWERSLAKHTWGQVMLSAGLGAMPGCLGAYAVTSLYVHRVITFGALVGAMVASCGDEAFVMLAMFPERAIQLMGLLLVAGVLTGLLTDLVFKGRKTGDGKRLDDVMAVHHNEQRCIPFSRREIVEQWRHCSPHRLWLTAFLLLFVAGVYTGSIGHQHFGVDEEVLHETEVEAGHVGHDHAADEADEADTEHETHGEWDWIRMTLLCAGLVGLLIVITVPEHFLSEHLWNHLFRVHVWRIFLWTLAALLVIRVLTIHVDVAHMAGHNRVLLLLVACLVGIIPESGPHMVFVSLYAEGAIPFSTLLASSIVQDGHGMIPMLAHSRRAFLGVKLINLGVGLAVGLIGLLLGW
ncbi:MAG: arsenic efflux protein [Lentisphaerae bacterium]|nr:arsenic efflux protein [Lentisphaerota bacterium]